MWYNHEKNEMTCSYCGKVQTGIKFAIESSKDSDEWVWYYYQKKLACPDCLIEAIEERQRLQELAFDYQDLQARVIKERSAMSLIHNML